MSCHGKKVLLVIITIALLLCIFLSGCKTVGTLEFYDMDLRALRVPVMLNANTVGQQGFRFQASIFESEDTQSYYSEYMSFTTSQTKESTVPLDLQIRNALLPEVFAAYIEGLSFSYHKMCGFARTENRIIMSAEVLLEER